ncbi:MAG TPA: DUF2934 domain-containing protein [Azospirillaceae bacterium]|nr:DUF2934 domain-containing protein [Azospirillaceae bacterium]
MYREDEERIRQRAHEIWEREGRPEGREQAHWDMARELVAQEQAHADTLRPNPSRGPDDVATRDQPVEPLLAVENLGDLPGLNDMGEERQFPHASRKEARES